MDGRWNFCDWLFVAGVGARVVVFQGVGVLGCWGLKQSYGAWVEKMLGC